MKKVEISLPIIVISIGILIVVILASILLYSYLVPPKIDSSYDNIDFGNNEEKIELVEQIPDTYITIDTPVKIEFNKTSKLIFNHQDINNTFVINKIQEDYIDITINDRIEKSLVVRKAEKIDLDKDGTPDIQIYLNKISQDTVNLDIASLDNNSA